MGNTMFNTYGNLTSIHLNEGVYSYQLTKLAQILPRSSKGWLKKHHTPLCVCTCMVKLQH